MVRRTGSAFTSATRIVPLLQRSRHFQLLRGAHALRLEWSAGQRRVRSVVYFDRAARVERRVSGAAVVVAAGALASTKLLLHSACADFPGGLGDTEGILGRYLHDHAHHWCVMDLDGTLPRLGHAAYLTRAPYRESPPLLAAQCTIGGSGDSLREKALSFTPVGTRSFGVVIFGTMVPEYRDHVKLDATARDEFGLPALDVHLRYDEEVARTVEAARGRLLAILDAAGYRSRMREPLPPLVPGTSVHFGGTVRMHRSPQHGMLDAWNRLHSVGNVAVVDASCFTTGVEKNPVPTAMALAARAAHRLAEDLRTSSGRLRHS
jgi:choline dehydrogenase-like flavoprotein